jgi:outer membrane protein TolC
MNTRWQITALSLALSFCAAPALAQVRGFDEIAHEYVTAALSSNLSLQSQDLQVEHALTALDAARARFWPELSMNARYTVSQGGRSIEFPIGQLLNPVYSTLNQMLQAQGQPVRFGTVSDQSFAFQRPHEQDTHVSLRQPLYQPAIPAAVAAQRELLSSEQFARLALSRQLRRDVTVAYARYLQALDAERIAQATVVLLEENQRVLDSLYRNGSVTQDQLLRAKAAALGATQQTVAAASAVSGTANYVNFLLNRPLNQPVEAALVGNVLIDQSGPKSGRPELLQLDAMNRAAEAQLRVARAALGPQLALGVDAGTQGEQYRLGSGYNYVAASLVLSWKFFDGGANRAAVSDARLTARRTVLAREQMAQRVELEVRLATDQLTTARSGLVAATAAEQAAVAARRIAQRKRDEGSISQTEFLDANTAATSAQSNLNIARFALLQSRAELAYANGQDETP